MSAKTEYRCNLCDKIVTQNESDSRYDTAVGLRWDTSRGTGDVLNIHPRWSECPIHLCVTCVANVARIHTDLQTLRKIP